jgi:phage terminase large subunit
MVYAQGLWGVLANLIYSNWQVIDRLPDQYDDIFYGLDFGFNNPTALIEIREWDKRIYERELLYKSGLTNPALIAHLFTLIPNRRSPIYADSAEPARIAEIKKAGFNVHPCEKKSVKDGILFVKTKDIYITKNSLNLIKEKQSYKWREDKDGNVVGDEPVGMDDHLMDAERYGLYSHLKTKKHIKAEIIEWD